MQNDTHADITDTSPLISPQSKKQTTINPDRSRLAQLVASLFVISLFILSGAALVYGSEVFFLVFAGILFAILLRSVANWLADKLPVSPKWAVLITAVGLTVLVGVGGRLLVPSLSQQVDKLSTTLPQSLEKLRETLSQHTLGQSILEKAPNAEQAVQGNSNLGKTVGSAFRITTKAIGNFVAIIFLGLFFAFSPSLYTNGIIALVPRRHEQRAREVLEALDTTLARWLIGQLFSMTIVAVLTTLGLWALGVELALVLGILAGILAFIPNIGPVISAVPAVMVGLLESPNQALWIVALYLVVQTVESYVFTPLIQKKMVSLPPALVLAVQFLMGITLGAFALAMATPLAAAVMVIVKMLYIQDTLGKSIQLPGEKDGAEREEPA